MTTENCKSLMDRVTQEAQAMVMLANDGSTPDVARYQRALQLIGKANGLLATTVAEHLAEIKGASATAAAPEKDPLANWMPLTIHETVMQLFETALYLDDFEERQTLFSLACEILDNQSFEDWILNGTDDGYTPPEPTMQ